MYKNGLKTSRISSGRVSKAQKRRLLTLMQQHRDVGKGQFKTPNARREHIEVWATVTNELNALGGSQKTADQWKKSWIDWKSSVKKQNNKHRAFSRCTGNLPDEMGPKPLDEMDSEVLEFFSSDMVDGDGETPEIVSVATAQIDIVQDEIFQEQDVVQPSPDQGFKILPDKPNHCSGIQSSVDEARLIIQAHHDEITNLMISQHTDHMNVLGRIETIMKEVFHALTNINK